MQEEIMRKAKLFLLALSWIYGGIIAIRNILYDKGVFVSKNLDCQVISVGNITAGGTGKTPFVNALAQWLVGYGRKVAIVSRGYKRQNKTAGVTIVSDGSKIVAPLEESGDEPYLLAGWLLEFRVPVVVSSDRFEGGRTALEHFGVDTILLDDGFQHRKLKRDVDIVLLDNLKPFGNGRILPAGYLRESKRQLKRAHLIAIAESGFDAETKIRKWSSAPVIRWRNDTSKVVNLSTGLHQSFSSLKNKRAVAFCGIARPEKFWNTLDSLDIDVIEKVSYRDHYYYQAADIRYIDSLYRRSNVEIILTTEKDSVKLKQEEWKKLPVFVVSIKIDLETGKDKLKETIL